MGEYCNVEYVDGKLVCHLPITTPTGKVRVLRADQPIATRQIPLQEGDVIEWQISYFAEEHTRLVELGKLLDLAYRHNLVEESQLVNLLAEIQRQREFFAEKYAITIGGVTVEEFYGFHVLKREVPILAKKIDDAVVWVELRHKQKAVGFQPMLYLRIPVESVSPKLIGRVAEPKQVAIWHPSPSLLFTALKAFSIASRKHHTDMISILERVLAKR